MYNYEIKPTIDPKNNYEKARKDVLQAMDSIQKLTQQQQQQLAYELIGIEAINSFVDLMNKRNR